jgi:phenylalanyl-tRNA synthetase alpha chain
MHDTFFLKKPVLCKEFPVEYGERVKEIHEKGGFGSLGY